MSTVDGEPRSERNCYTPEKYQRVKARMAADPEYRERRRAQQKAAEERRKARYATDPEFRSRVRAKNKAYRATHADKSRKWREANPDKVLADRARRREAMVSARCFEGLMFQQWRHRSKRCGIPFDIAEGELAIPEACPVLGIPLDRRDRDHAPSVDRVDNALGYVRGNVQVISMKANRLKSDATEMELEAVLAYVRKNKPTLH